MQNSPWHIAILDCHGASLRIQHPPINVAKEIVVHFPFLPLFFSRSCISPPLQMAQKYMYNAICAPEHHLFHSTRIPTGSVLFEVDHLRPY